MSIWSNIAKMAGGAAKGTWGFAKAGGRSLGNTVIHPAQTLKGAMPWLEKRPLTPFQRQPTT